MSAQPIDDGGPAYPRASTVLPDGTRWTESQTGQSYRADVAKECLAALVGRARLDEWNPDGLARNAIRYADALIAALKGGAK